MYSYRNVLAACVLFCAAIPASADTVSFTGNFLSDDDIQFFSVFMPTSGDLTIRTLGYGGGTNGAGVTFSPGGFDPAVWLFGGSGSTAMLLNSNDDAGGAPVLPGCGIGCFWDSYLANPGMPAGLYTVVLTQYGNNPNGSTLGDGFSRMTPLAGAFVDSNLTSRTSFWAVDISGPSVSVTATPEPATAGIVGICLAGLVVSAVRRRNR